MNQRSIQFAGVHFWGHMDVWHFVRANWLLS